MRMGADQYKPMELACPVARFYLVPFTRGNQPMYELIRNKSNEIMRVDPKRIKMQCSPLTEVIFVGDNIKALENVVEDEPHFFMKGLLGPNGGSYGGKGGRGGFITGRGDGGVEKISSMRSKLIVNGEDCLDGWDGAGR
ncbi:hypothetical protein Tco_0110229 [Tanacetum coccineum]